MNEAGSIPNRWLVLIMGTCLQLCLGTVYAWSYFQQPLVQQFGWTNTQVALTFSLAICSLGIAAAIGGVALPRTGPRLLATAGGLLFGGGYLLAALALHLKSLPLLYIGYGVIGGAGLGLGYVTPVATVAKWFPDKKGLATGIVIMGFGLGALLMSKVLAPQILRLSHDNLPRAFAAMGLVFCVATAFVSHFLRNPAADAQAGAAAAGAASTEESARGQILSVRFGMLWLVFFCNILAGISIIGFQSPLFQDLWRKIDGALSKEALAALGATLIAVSSLFNGLGRMFWGGLSDRIGRATTFRVMLGTQILAFLCLMRTGNPWIFGALVCYILLCYGGGFGTMPSFVLTVFGKRTMAVVYGTILTAWSAAGVVGPQVVAYIKDHWAAQASLYSFATGTAFLVVGFVLSLALHDKAHSSKQG